MGPLATALAETFGTPSGDFPDIAGSYSGRLIIIGGADCVWRDLDEIGIQGADIMCINDIGMHLPRPFQHWWSNHGNQLPVWQKARSFRYKDSQILHCNLAPKNPGSIEGVIRWPVPGHGSSGINATYCAALLGYEEIILCGVPYTNDGHYFDPPRDHVLWNDGNRPPIFGHEGFARLWDKANQKIFQGRVKSMSGMTSEILGRPD